MTDLALLKSLLPGVMDSAVDLSEIGCDELAWPRNEALEVAECLRSHDLAVLGGDVLEIKDGEPRHTYDNWYARERPVDMGWDEFVQATYDRTVDYISRYNETGRRIVYVLVFKSEGGKC